MNMEEDIVSTKQASKSRAHGGQQQRQDNQKQKDSRQRKLSIDDELVLELQNLNVNDDSVKTRKARKTPQKSRKALKHRDANAVTNVKVHTQDVCEKNTPESRKTLVEVRIPVRQKGTSVQSRSKPSPSSNPLHESSFESQGVGSQYVSPLLTLSDRKRVLSFETWLAELEPHFEITKIAEASFSEVYRLTARSSANGHKQESVLKVVALKTDPTTPLPCQQQTRTIRDRDAQIAKEMAERDVKDQWKSHVADVLSEVKLLQNLNYIPGFTVFRDLTVVQGRPSAALNNAWKSWNKSRRRGEKSQFPDPTKKASYDDDQLWAVVEMQDAGTDCEKIMEMGGLTSIWDVWDVFWGVCLSVAKAEEACEFEHRDLHLGNICVRPSKTASSVFDMKVHDPVKRKLRFTGVETTVIDYTLSRANMVAQPSRRSSSISCISNTTAGDDSLLRDIDVAYLDLNKDPAIFEGDASQEYQYEIYRYMRGAALFNNPLQSTPQSFEDPPRTPRRSPQKNTHIRFDGSDGEEALTPRRSPRKHTSNSTQRHDKKDIWRSFHPKTNLVWAHFLLHKLLAHMQHHGTTPDTLAISAIMQHVLGEEDAVKVKKKAGKLYKILKRVSQLLCPVALGRSESLGSMKELVVLALEERWLRVSDVEG